MILEEILQDVLSGLDCDSEADRRENARMYKRVCIEFLIDLVARGYVSGDEITAHFLRDIPRRH